VVALEALAAGTATLAAGLVVLDAGAWLVAKEEGSEIIEF
jgi:hypothetical protein